MRGVRASSSANAPRTVKNAAAPAPHARDPRNTRRDDRYGGRFMRATPAVSAEGAPPPAPLTPDPSPRYSGERGERLSPLSPVLRGEGPRVRGPRAAIPSL